MADLDFTRPPAASAQAAPRRAPGEDKRIGVPVPGAAGNLICYARRLPGRPAAATKTPVVVVEDDQGSRALLEAVVSSLGFPVRAVADAKEFLETLRQPPLPQLILLDVELPRVSGFKLLSVLREHPQTSEIPVILVTGRSDNKDLLQGMSLGAAGYLSKPVAVATLRSMIDLFIRRAG